jgi:hypothetical protein
MPPSVENGKRDQPSAPRTRRSLWAWVFGGVALSVVALACVACVWRPDAAAALTLIPVWCWPAGGLLTALPIARIGARRAFWLLVLFWVGFSVALVEELTSTARIVVDAVRSPSEKPTVRIVSLNCANSPHCVDDLKRVDPDIALLQEAPGSDQLGKIARTLYGDSGNFLAGGDTAILARGRIEPLFVDRAAHFVAGSVGLENGRRFTCISLRLTPPPARLDFWSAGFWADHRNLRQQHRQQLQQIKSRIDAHWNSRPLVLGGDFNTVPRDRALDELQPTFHDTFISGGRGWGATGTNDWPLFRVDQIWTNSRPQNTCTRTIRTDSSDHRIVIFDAFYVD